MFRILTCLLIASSTYILAEPSYENRFQFTSEEMEQHKKICKEQMLSNPANRRDKSYQMKRALLTMSGSDADYIPKVQGAGEIFTNDGAIPYQLMHNGVKIVLNSYYDTQWITDVIYGLKGHHEPQEEKCFFEVLKAIPENGTMIELGSFWAYYSLWFATEVKGAKNYLVEPNAKRLEAGRQNFALNNKTGVFRQGFIGVMKESDPEAIGVDCIGLGDLMKMEGIEHVNILHADIQGAESEMLESIVEHLDKIDYFFISTHRHESDHLPCLRFMKTHGLIILAEHTGSESCSGDGLIVAKRKGVPGPEQISIRKY